MNPWLLGCWYYTSIVVLKKQHGVSLVASWMGVCQTLLISWSWQLLTKVEAAPAWKGEVVLSASHCLCLVDCYCFFIVPGGVEKDTLKCTLSKWRLRLVRAWLWDSLHLLSTQGVAACNIDSEAKKVRFYYSSLIGSHVKRQRWNKHFQWSILHADRTTASNDLPLAPGFAHTLGRMPYKWFQR